VELELGVSGRAGDDWIPRVEYYPNPPFEYSYANKVIKRGCDKLGIRLWPAPVARLSRPYNGRPACVNCGTCDRGCISGAKSSMDITYIPKAEATGKAQIWPETMVTRIKMNARGKAESVLYFDKNGIENELKADIIIVSAGAIQSPRLLLNSKSKMYPDGLCNSSGLVGKYFMQHFGAGASGFFSERIDAYRGFQGGPISEDFPKNKAKHSFVRGFRLDLAGDCGPVEAARRLPQLWGQQLKNTMRSDYGHVTRMSALGEQLPDERNYIELDPTEKDNYGMPVPRINIEWRDNEKEMFPYMEALIKDIYDAAGAIKTVDWRRDQPGGSAHNAGSCRMGNNSKKSVLNSYCQSHDIANLFVIDGSCFVSIGIANPTLTIQAIAVRASEYILEQARKGNL
jgi:choline dehydrogenase-like flavoprotein